MALNYFDMTGEWVAFRRDENDRFVFDTVGSVIGWVPSGGSEVVRPSGEYLGTLIEDRLVRRKAPATVAYPVNTETVAAVGVPTAPEARPRIPYLPSFEDVPAALVGRAPVVRRALSLIA